MTSANDTNNSPVGICDVCGWPVWEWQAHRKRYIPRRLVTIVEHLNPADHKVTTIRPYT